MAPDDGGNPERNALPIDEQEFLPFGTDADLMLAVEEITTTPRLLPSIDAIARSLQRDVLFIRFAQVDEVSVPHGHFPPNRQLVIDWLNAQSIRWMDCGDFAADHGWRAWCGEIFVADALPIDTDELTQKLNAFLEYPDGTSRFEGVRFCMLSLETAMKNAHHDDAEWEWDL